MELLYVLLATLIAAATGTKERNCSDILIGGVNQTQTFYDASCKPEVCACSNGDDGTMRLDKYGFSYCDCCKGQPTGLKSQTHYCQDQVNITGLELVLEGDIRKPCMCESQMGVRNFASFYVREYDGLEYCECCAGRILDLVMAGKVPGLFDGEIKTYQTISDFETEFKPPPTLPAWCNLYDCASGLLPSVGTCKICPCGDATATKSRRKRRSIEDRPLIERQTQTSTSALTLTTTSAPTSNGRGPITAAEFEAIIASLESSRKKREVDDSKYAGFVYVYHGCVDCIKINILGVRYLYSTIWGDEKCDRYQFISDIHKGIKEIERWEPCYLAGPSMYLKILDVILDAGYHYQYALYVRLVDLAESCEPDGIHNFMKILHDGKNSTSYDMLLPCLGCKSFEYYWLKNGMVSPSPT